MRTLGKVAPSSLAAGSGSMAVVLSVLPHDAPPPLCQPPRAALSLACWFEARRSARLTACAFFLPRFGRC